MLEIVVGVSILTASFLGVLTVFNNLVKSSRSMIHLYQSAFLLEEGVEAGRILRDQSWTNLGGWSSGTAYHLVWTGSAWSTSTTPTLLDGLYERKITETNVSRDNISQDIVTSGGTLDPGTKLVTVTVAWLESGATTTKSLSTYLTNIVN